MLKASILPLFKSKYKIYFLTLALSLIVFSFKVSSFQDPAIKKLQLTWDFFKNNKPLTAKNDASVRYDIKYRYWLIKQTGNHWYLKFDVYMKLDTANSYVDFKKKKPELLHHEQGHVDIGILYVMKLKMALESKPFYESNYDTQIRNIFTQFFQKADQENLKYDRETKNGNNKKAQTKWDQYIGKELNTMSSMLFNRKK